MHFEHVALNVPDAPTMAAWYIKYCRMQIVRAIERPPHTHFLADQTGQMVLELYSNEAAPIPDYAEQHPLCLHVAFAVEDATQDRERLLAAGAVLFSDTLLDDGTHLVMLRDPWGVALQLVQRAAPLT